jgi:nicotinate-nucleotide pyrophosphorylase (carboxylating)
MNLIDFIKYSIAEDVGAGDFSSICCIPPEAVNEASLWAKEDGIVAGIKLAELICKEIDLSLTITSFASDGDQIKKGDCIFKIYGSVQHILKAERLILNCMQRMSGIATTTRKYVDAVAGTNAKILDTRKTTPLNRYLEKWAVRIGGGFNHRFGLFDMIMLKDNHIDFAGGISKAIATANQYLEHHKMSLPIEIETRSLAEIKQVLAIGNVHRIMLDNFTPDEMQAGIDLIDGRFETEASGGIILENVRNYAITGVDFISVGALTHSVKSIDLSLKASK